jgi:hypothetical protein
MEETFKIITPQMRIAHLDRLADHAVTSSSNSNSSVIAIVIAAVGTAMLIGVVIYYEWRVEKLKK